MAYQFLDQLLIAPGFSSVLPTPIAATDKLVVRPLPGDNTPNAPIGYLRSLVVISPPSIEPFTAVYRSWFVNAQNLWIPPLPGTAGFGGWFAQFYVLNKANGSIIDVIFYREQ